MNSIAWSRLSTTLIASTRSRYSVSQSAALHGAASTSAQVAASPRNSTPAARNSAAAAGRKRSATAECTSSVSAALHTAGYWVLASWVMRVAIAKSAAAST